MRSARNLFKLSFIRYLLSLLVLFREQHKYTPFVLECQHFVSKNIFYAFLNLFIVSIWERWYNQTNKIGGGYKVRTNEEIVTIIENRTKEKGIYISELARRIDIAISTISRYLIRI